MSSAGSASGSPPCAVDLDLRGEICPFTFVRCKLAMEQMQPGQQLTVLVDNANAASNVPVSLRQWGQQVTSVEPVETDHGVPTWRIVAVRLR